MERNLEAEIDSLKNELAELKNLVGHLVPQMRNHIPGSEQSKEDTCKDAEETVDITRPLKRIHPMRHMHPDKRLSEIMEELCILTDEQDTTGMITYMGVFSSGDRQSNWIRHTVGTDGLLELIENHTAEKVLACIGSSDRLNILLAILKKPMTVAELVSVCHLNSTGQAYHHMKPLIAADLIVEDVKNSNKGVYVVQPHKVQGIIMLLAGICDMVDETYTKGCWDASGSNLPSEKQ